MKELLSFIPQILPYVGVILLGMYARSIYLKMEKEKLTLHEYLIRKDIEFFSLLAGISTVLEVVSLTLIAIQIDPVTQEPRMDIFGAISRYGLTGIIEVVFSIRYIAELSERSTKALEDGKLTLWETINIFVKTIPLFLGSFLATNVIAFFYYESLNWYYLIQHPNTQGIAKYFPFATFYIISDKEALIQLGYEPKRIEFGALVMIYTTTIFNLLMFYFTISKVKKGIKLIKVEKGDDSLLNKNKKSDDKKDDNKNKDNKKDDDKKDDNKKDKKDDDKKEENKVESLYSFPIRSIETFKNITPEPTASTTITTKLLMEMLADMMMLKENKKTEFVNKHEKMINDLIGLPTNGLNADPALLHEAIKQDPSKKEDFAKAIETLIIGQAATQTVKGKGYLAFLGLVDKYINFEKAEVESLNAKLKAAFDKDKREYLKVLSETQQAFTEFEANKLKSYEGQFYNTIKGLVSVIQSSLKRTNIEINV